eukprot:TRINITY_DN572_c0_g2_i1.p1 TRINITY_DN572_c0_g2~~TRINITY_DN572_c0_g2_i1.p1  ORF type:complete len:187 (+),score=41.28 TRINITY_DN572_c0_g2_i1:269-829(+)
MAAEHITPEYVLSLRAPTDEFLCPTSSNTYGIDFLHFKIRDFDSNKTIFEVQKEPSTPEELQAMMEDSDDSYRTIHYDFDANFLRLKTVGTTLVFKVGDNEIPNFRMIERHYFRDHLLKSFDFTFGFCIPNSTNSWEAIYTMPELDPDLEAEILANPYETKSDSFYFVNDELIMHNKAEYNYQTTD